MKELSSKSQIRLVLGLGNPGREYENTYHNVGFLFINYLLEESRQNSKFEIRNSKLLKSNVYMNESGSYVRRAMKKYGAKPAELLVVHDDSDIKLGNYKLSFDRGSAGHKGVASVIEALGTKKFWRLRLGVRPRSLTNADYAQTNAEKRSGPRESASSLRSSAARRAKAGEFVLKKITRADQKILEGVFEETLKKILNSNIEVRN